MIEVLVLAAGVAAGVPVPTLAAIGLVHLSPGTALILWAVAMVMARRGLDPAPEEALLMMAIAGELRAGQSLRGAIASATTHQRFTRTHRLARAGSPIETVADRLASELSGGGRLLGAVIEVADRVGGPAAAAFEQLAAVALTEAELRRERRTAVAPAMIQAILVGGVPLVVLVTKVLDRSIWESLGGGGVERLVVGAGILLISVGTGWVGLMARRALR